MNIHGVSEHILSPFLQPDHLLARDVKLHNLRNILSFHTVGSSRVGGERTPFPAEGGGQGDIVRKKNHQNPICQPHIEQICHTTCFKKRPWETKYIKKLQISQNFSKLEEFIYRKVFVKNDFIFFRLKFWKFQNVKGESYCVIRSKINSNW